MNSSMRRLHLIASMYPSPKRSFSEVVDEDGLLWLEGKQNLDGWVWQGNSIVITIYRDEGMTRVIPANPK